MDSDTSAQQRCLVFAESAQASARQLEQYRHEHLTKEKVRRQAN